ncbi:MAG: GAF domain-containing protein [Agriterribacter sp.]
MKVPIRLPDEELRLRDLMSYEILDTAEEKEFNDLTTLAAQICGCEIAAITFIDADRQWFKAKRNVVVQQAPRDFTFCGHTILENKVMVVSNAKDDDRFFDNPQVMGGIGITFYAGAPIISSAGFALGTICVIDKKEKEGLTPEQENALRIIASQITSLLELRIKNKQVLKKSEALIKSEKKVTLLNMELQEEKNNLIAVELHENYAQTLTAIKLYIDFAQQSKDIADVFLDKCKERLLAVVEELKNLSKTIYPTTLQNADYYLLIDSLAKHYTEEFNIDVEFYHDRRLENNDPKTGIKVYRIVEQQLKIAKNTGATNVKIELRQGKKLSLVFKYNSSAEHIDIEKEMLFSNVIARPDLLNGKTTYRKDKEGLNIVDIKIPMI